MAANTMEHLAYTNNQDVLNTAVSYVVDDAIRGHDTVTVGFFPRIDAAVVSELTQRSDANALNFVEVPPDQAGRPNFTGSAIRATDSEFVLFMTCPFYGLDDERTTALVQNLPSYVSYIVFVDQTEGFSSEASGVRTLVDSTGRPYDAHCLALKSLIGGAAFAHSFELPLPVKSKSYSGVVVGARSKSVSVVDLDRYRVETTHLRADQHRRAVHAQRVATLRKVVAPRRLIIEPSSKCNFLCPKCVYPFMKRDQGFMDIDNMTRFLDAWVSEYGEFDQIDLTGSGEALYNKELEAMIRAIRALMPTVRITVTSNLALLKEDVADRLLEAGLRDWQVSFDSAVKEEFEEFTKSKKYDRVLANIQLLYARMEANGHPDNQLTIVAHRPYDENYESGMQAIKDLLAGSYHQISCSPYQSLNGRIVGEKYAGSEKNFYQKDIFPLACNYLWDDLVVVHNGDVRLCCSDMFDTEVNFGNIFTDTPRQIVENASREHFKKSQIAGKVDDLYLCKDCHAPFAHV